MYIRHLNTCNVRLGGSAALVAVITAALVAAPTEHRQLSAEIHQVQLTATVLAAVGNNAPPESPSPEDFAESAPESDAFVIGAQDAVLAAAATEENFLDTPLGTVLALANFVALPLWFLFTPITLPLSMLAGASTVTMDGPFGTLQFLIATGLTFITGPLGLLSTFLNSSASAAAAEVPGAGSSVSADKMPAQAAATAAPAVVAVEDGLVGQSESAERTADSAERNEERSSAVERTRGRLLVRSAGTGSRAAAAVTTADPTVVGPSVESRASETVAKHPTSSAREVERARSSMPEVASTEPRAAKSRAAMSGSRR